MKLDSSGNLWFVNSRNYLFKTFQDTSNKWHVNIVAEFSGYLKSKIQGKLIKLNSRRNILVWKINDNQIMRICTKTGNKKLLNINFCRLFDFICDFKINKYGDKICILCAFDHIVM